MLPISAINSTIGTLVPLIIFEAFKKCSEGLSLTRYPMYAALTANVINVFLNYCFIFGHFGAPALGVVGAAIGTLASRVIMIGVLWWLMANHQKAKWYVRRLRWRMLSAQVMRKINYGPAITRDTAGNHLSTVWANKKWENAMFKM